MKKNPLGKYTIKAFGYFLAFGGLAWVLHDINWRELSKTTTEVQWVWIIPAIACDVISYLCQGWRWALLLRPLGRISSWKTTQAIYIGLFINEILPMRLGEIARAFLLGRWMEHDISAIIPSMAVERLQDAIWLAAAFGLTALFVPLPDHLMKMADLLGLITLGAVALFLFLTLRPRRAEPIPCIHAIPISGFRHKLLQLTGTLAQGIRQIGFSPALYLSFLGSFLLLVFQALAFWLLMPACRLNVSFWTGMVVFLIVHVGTAIPNTPANIGSYQFFTVLGLTLFGVDKTSATAFSLIAFFLLTLPLWLIGFLALARSGTTWAGLRKEIGRLAADEPSSP